jgi:hypothetical protein
MRGHYENDDERLDTVNKRSKFFLQIFVLDRMR